mgnify:CR=1 FL=1
MASYKAFMSDQGARYARRMEEREVYLPAEAEREARAILAESEPGHKGDSKTWWGSVTHRYITGLGSYPTRRDPYFAALAEALRAFVEEGQ